MEELKTKQERATGLYPKWFSWSLQNRLYQKQVCFGIPSPWETWGQPLPPPHDDDNDNDEDYGETAGDLDDEELTQQMAGDGGDVDTNAIGNAAFEQDEEEQDSVEDTNDQIKQDVDSAHKAGAHCDGPVLPRQRVSGELPSATEGRERAEGIEQGEGRGYRKKTQQVPYWHKKQYNWLE